MELVLQGVYHIARDSVPICWNGDYYKIVGRAKVIESDDGNTHLDISWHPPFVDRASFKVDDNEPSMLEDIEVNPDWWTKITTTDNKLLGMSVQPIPARARGSNNGRAEEVPRLRVQEPGETEPPSSPL